jgi:hypothetical protein
MGPLHSTCTAPPRERHLPLPSVAPNRSRRHVPRGGDPSLFFRRRLVRARSQHHAAHCHEDDVHAGAEGWHSLPPLSLAWLHGRCLVPSTGVLVGITGGVRLVTRTAVGDNQLGVMRVQSKRQKCRPHRWRRRCARRTRDHPRIRGRCTRGTPSTRARRGGRTPPRAPPLPTPWGRSQTPSVELTRASPRKKGGAVECLYIEKSNKGKLRMTLRRWRVQDLKTAVESLLSAPPVMPAFVPTGVESVDRKDAFRDARRSGCELVDRRLVFGCYTVLVQFIFMQECVNFPPKGGILFDYRSS